MECCLVHASNDFMVPTGKDGLEVIPPSTEYWFQWGVSEFENDGFARKYSGACEKENLGNLNYDSRVPPVNESMVPQVHLGEGLSSSSPGEDGLLLDCSMITSDDLFDDLPDFQSQTSMQNMDDIFLDSFPFEDLMHLENPYESIYIPDSINSPWNWRISELEDSDTLMKDLSGREDAVNEDHNFEAPYSVDACPIAEGFITTTVDDPVCTGAAVLQELEDVMLQLNSKTRLCIRDALYRLANSTKEQNVNLCQSESFKDLPSHSNFCCGTSRREPSRSLEPKTNEIDRAIAALMFDRPDYRVPQFPSSHPFLKNKENEAASAGS